MTFDPTMVTTAVLFLVVAFFGTCALGVAVWLVNRSMPARLRSVSEEAANLATDAVREVTSLRLDFVALQETCEGILTQVEKKRAQAAASASRASQQQPDETAPEPPKDLAYYRRVAGVGNLIAGG